MKNSALFGLAALVLVACGDQIDAPKADSGSGGGSASTSAGIGGTGGTGGIGGSGGGGTGGSTGTGGEPATLKLDVSVTLQKDAEVVCKDQMTVEDGFFQLQANSQNPKPIVLKKVTWTREGIGFTTDIAYVQLFGDAFNYLASDHVIDPVTHKISFDLGNTPLPPGIKTVLIPVLNFDTNVSGGQHRMSILPGDFEIEEGEITGLPLW